MEVLLDVQKAIQGDKDAFCRIIKATERKLYIIARSRLINIEDIKDAIQETIMYAYINIKNIRDINKFNSWITKILINCCNKIYKQNDLKSFSYNQLEDNNFNFSIENDFFELENKLNFFNIIDFLSIDEKTLITMFYLDDYTTREISDILKINESTIRSRMANIRRKIKKHLGRDNN